MRILITEKQNKMIRDKHEWQKVSKKLIKTFYFKNYKEVMSFVKDVMEIADDQDHHPDIIVHYDNVKLSITDHEKDGVSDKCHKFAEAVDDLF